jgi:hypothetical protein
MSNVLIGIIGVILFIGLALAGALFLGPRFQESTNNSKASAAIQAVTQVTQASDMYQAQEGKSYTDVMLNGIDSLAPNYLKSVPAVQGGAAINFRTEIVGGTTIALAASTLSGTTGNTSKSVCEAIAKQTTGDTVVPSQPSAVAGCFYNGSRYVVYSRMM